MKRNTLDKKIKIANDIMFYIYTHIDTDIDIRELSKQFAISRFYMQRIFKEIFGANIYESIKSIRLQKASNLLLTNRLSTISEIANQCGYSSHSSFIKAFKGRFGSSPKEWRGGGYKEYSKKILSQSKKAMSSRADFSKLTHEIVKMPPIKSYYLRHKGFSSDNLKETWQKINTWILSNSITNYTQIALFHDNPAITPLQECYYIACVSLEDESKMLKSRMPQFTISEGVYAKFDIEGTQGDLLKFIHWVYHEWLPKSGYETTTKPSYVIYRKNNFLSKDGFFDLSFYVSVRF